jgi:hypothetical protein
LLWTKKAEEYLNAVRSGLESKEQLSDPIPKNHSERVIRGYLKQVRSRLESSLRTVALIPGQA